MSNGLGMQFVNNVHMLIMTENARHHRTAPVSDYYKGNGMQQIEWVAYSVEVNQIGHVGVHYDTYMHHYHT